MYRLRYNCRFIGGKRKELDRFDGENKEEGRKRYLLDKKKGQRTLRLSTPTRENGGSGVETYKYKGLKDVTMRGRQFGELEI